MGRQHGLSCVRVVAEGVQGLPAQSAGGQIGQPGHGLGVGDRGPRQVNSRISKPALLRPALRESAVYQGAEGR